jgi:solute carrier family 27 fatty acid transporter 1/4
LQVNRSLNLFSPKNKVNIVQKLGSCGFTPLLNKIIPVFPLYVIKIDTKMNPIRDSRGFCVKCEPGEKGLLVGIIGNNPVTAYNGYANNSQASRTKVLENVFRKGQSGFNSGDLMTTDSLGYMYFCDRLGDTYRWRGENVSTIEVENVISRNLDSREVVVYGVEVPGQEGKAGMAAVNCQPKEVDLSVLGTKLKTDLPNYAKPIFIRFVQDVDHTG